MSKSKSFSLGGLTIDPVAYGSQGSAILGIRDSGKTFSATWFAERLFEAGIPFISFDPIGVWRFLRVPGAGKGYPVVVAGGQDGDLPLTVASAPEIVRAAMANGVSLVIDLFDINLSKADWKRIVTACVRVLLHENAKHGLRHVFIEEAAEFAPQRVGPDQGHVYAEIEKLARMGGNSRLGYTLINQRAEEVNKAVLELCDNLFLHRQKGRNSLQALTKWLDIGNVADAKAIIGTLSTLPTGDCWAWLAGTETPVRVTVPAKNSLHPDRRVIRGDVSVKSSKAVNVASFVDTMKASLGKIEEEAKANDPAALRREIAALQKQLGAASKGQFDPKTIEMAGKRGYENAFMEMIAASTKARKELAKQHDGLIEDLRTRLWHEIEVSSLFPRSYGQSSQPGQTLKRASDASGSYPASVETVADVERRAKPDGHPAPKTEASGQFSRSETKVLRALMLWRSLGNGAPTKIMVAGAAGYSPGSGNFANLLSKLRGAGAVDYPTGGAVRLLLTNVEPLSRDEAREALLSLMKSAQRKLFDALIDGELSKVELAERTGYSAGSGNFANLLSKLRSLSIVEYPQRGQVALEPWVHQIL